MSDVTGESGRSDEDDSSGDALIDPFFEYLPGTDWNACVGKQGYEENYVDGYMEAAQRLVALVMDKQLAGSRDTLVLPILYNARHGIELALKFTINRLHGLGMIADRHPVNHDIFSHWRHLSDANVGDEAMRALIAELQPYVVSLAAIDDDGQQLRYAEDQSGAKSLGDLAVVNLKLIRHSLGAVGSILSRMKYRVLDLRYERGTGTFTSKCSRSDLKVIATMVGPRAAWSDLAFDVAKAAVLERFGLGSRDFSKALDTIQKSRELATIIGVETQLCHLSDERALFALEHWAEAHPPFDPDKNTMGIDVFDRDWDSFRREARAARSLDETIIESLQVEEISDLEALFYIGREAEFGEFYEEGYREALEKNRLEEPFAYVHHLMSKTNLLDAVVNGCRIAGRPSLASRLRAIRA